MSDEIFCGFSLTEELNLLLSEKLDDRTDYYNAIHELSKECDGNTKTRTQVEKVIEKILSEKSKVEKVSSEKAKVEKVVEKISPEKAKVDIKFYDNFSESELIDLIKNKNPSTKIGILGKDFSTDRSIMIPCTLVVNTNYMKIKIALRVKRAKIYFQENKNTSEWLFKFNHDSVEKSLTQLLDYFYDDKDEMLDDISSTYNEIAIPNKSSIMNKIFYPNIYVG